MLFNSSVFLFAFLPLTVAAYYGLGRTRHSDLPLVALVVASLIFYGWWNADLVLLLMSSVVLNFGAGLWIAAAQNGSTGRYILIGAVAGNLAVLGFYKYAGFAVAAANDIGEFAFTVPAIVLPLAISFFTFQQIAYLADVRRDRVAERSLLRYSLFVTFFPQLIAGPIVHHREILPQYANRPASRPDTRKIALGISVFAIGLFKKVVIADNVARLATPVFTAAAADKNLTFFEAWCGTLAYTFQIYFDFSGYSDMAIGLGLIFGFRLPVNFWSPYKATSIIDFWRRWHITLSRFLRDYLYIPLGGSRHGRARRYVNLAVTMVLGGLWHGAGWTFVVWGALHGSYLVINHFWRWLVGMLFPAYQGAGVAGRWVGRVVTFLAIAIAWVFFRADNIDTALRMLATMSGANGIALPLSVKPLLGAAAGTLESLGIAFTGMFNNNVVNDPASDLTFLVVLLIFVWSAPSSILLLRGIYRSAPRLPDPVYRLRDRVSFRWRPTPLWGVFSGILLALCFLSLHQVSEFIYFNF